MHITRGLKAARTPGLATHRRQPGETLCGRHLGAVPQGVRSNSTQERLRCRWRVEIDIDHYALPIYKEFGRLQKKVVWYRNPTNMVLHLFSDFKSENIASRCIYIYCIYCAWRSLSKWLGIGCRNLFTCMFQSLYSSE